MNKPWITEEEHACIVAYADALLAGADFVYYGAHDDRPRFSRINIIADGDAEFQPYEKPALFTADAIIAEADKAGGE